jgi:hypothetical protein
MRPHEFWMHACAAREGMIQTAVKTADAGYLMRRMVKTLENVSVCYDDTVRTGAGHVVQFQYGGDGLDPSTSRYHHPRRIEPGEPVGVVCAQSIGAKLTQLTLDTFHSTGQAFKHGIMRVKCLLDAAPRRDAGLLRDAPRPYRFLRYHLGDVIVHWTRITRRVLPTRVRLEMRMRNMRSALVWKVELSLAWLRARGVQPWHVAARVREQCPCACDATHLYVARKVTGEHGADWATDTLMNDSIVLAGRAPLDTRAYTSEPPEVARQLGIEAAGVVLRRELGAYMSGVDERHLMLLSDAMTQTGDVLGATRTGMRRADAVSVLGRACFETGPQILAVAAVARASDPLYAASSRLAMGLVPRVGGNAIDIVPSSTVAKAERPHSFMDHPPPKRRRFHEFMTI